MSNVRESAYGKCYIFDDILVKAFSSLLTTYLSMMVRVAYLAGMVSLLTLTWIIAPF